MIKLLVSFGGEVSATSTNGVSCFHLACVSGNLEVVKYLIQKHHVDFHIKSTASGSEPIHVAANAGHKNIVEFLFFDCGVDIKTEDKNGENSLSLAIKNRKTELAVWLVKTDLFKLNEIIKRSGFNYFAYALIKGQKNVALEIL